MTRKNRQDKCFKRACERKKNLTRRSKLYYSREKYNLTRSRDRRRSTRH